MKFSQIALLATIAMNALASGKVVRREAQTPNYAHGLRFLSPRETSLFAGVYYENSSDGEAERAEILSQNQKIFDENISMMLQEVDREEDLEIQMDDLNLKEQEAAKNGAVISEEAQLTNAKKRELIFHQKTVNQRHPVILVPGLGGSAILGYRTGVAEGESRVRTLWVGLSMMRDIVAKHYPLALKYDANADMFENEISNLKTQIRDFGGVDGMKIIDAGILSKVKSFQRIYLEDVVTALEKRGYRVGQDLRGAPYDFRLVGDIRVRNAFYQDLKKLIEETYEMNGRVRVHLTGHSLGSILSMNFLNTFMADNQEWKDKYIETYTSIAAPFLGAPKALKTMLSGDNLGVSIMKEQYIAQLTSSFSCMLWMMPHIHAENQTLTPKSDVTNFVSYHGHEYNNTQASLKELFAQFNRDPNLMTSAIEKQIFPLYNMGHPKVNVNCIYGYNVGTENGYEYREGHDQPIISYGNGDGTVPLESLQYCQQWGDNENYDVHVREFEHTSHEGILTNDRFLRYFSDIAHPHNDDL